MRKLVLSSLTCTLLSACTRPSESPIEPRTATLRSLTACELGRAADYSGTFDVLGITPQTADFSELRLRLVEPFISTPENAKDENPARSQVLSMRETKPGGEIVAMLAVPEQVRAGSRVLVFMGYNSRLEYWADMNFQGVFVPSGDRYWNNGLYPPGESAIGASELRSEALRGSRLSRTGPGCPSRAFVPADAGSSRLLLDGGSP